MPTQEAARRRMHMRVLEWTMFGCVIVLAASLTVTAVWAWVDSNHRREAQVQACERGNVVRHRINRLDAAIALPGPPLPILDCPKVVR